MVNFVLAMALATASPGVALLPLQGPADASERIGARLAETLQLAGLSLVATTDSDAVLAGKLSATTDGAFQLAVALTETRTARLLATRRLEGRSEASLLEGLPQLAADLTAVLTGAPLSEPPTRVKLWLPLFLAGAAGVGLSTIFFVQADGLSRRLANDTGLSIAQARGLAASREGLLTGGWVAGGLGLACIAGGLVALLLPPAYRLTVAVVPLGSGGLFALGWEP